MATAADTRPRDATTAAVGRPPSWMAALAGALAALAALAVSSLLSGAVASLPSLVVAVGDRVVDNVPGAIEQWAIATLGTADKPALLTGIVVLSAALGAALGVLGARQFLLAAAGFAAFGIVGAAAAAVASALWAAAVVAVVSAATGIAVLWWLLGRARTPSTGVSPGRVSSSSETASAPAGAVAEPIGTRATRRAFLRAAGVAAAATVISAGAGRYLVERRSLATARADVRLPPPARAAADPTAAVTFDVDGLHPWITPNVDFYRIDTALRVPQVDPAGWQLAVTGMVDRPFALTYDDLLAEPLEEHHITIACVSNEVGGDLVDNARWLGVRLDRLLERAGVKPGATQVVGRSVDGFTVGFPTDVARDGRAALVAVGMNGEPLPAEHGFPARLVVPGLFGYVSATKWLSEIELTTWEGFDAYWIPRGWAKSGPIVTQSQIQVPRSGATLPAGRTVVAGLAWAPTRGVARVELSIDDGPWRETELAAAYNDDTWRQWRFTWDAPPGEHTLRVRATDGTGEVQSAEVSPPAPDGATGLHAVAVSIT